MISHRRLWTWFTPRTPRPRCRSAGLAAIVETMEQRILPAGNVAAIVVGNNLVVRGDADSNSVQITTSAGDVIVKGLDGTTVNGSIDPFVAFDGTTAIGGNLVVLLRGGDDVAFLSGGLNVAGNVRIVGHAGANRIGTDNVNIGGELIIRGDTGDDAVDLENSNLGGRVRIRAGDGDNTVTMLNASIDAALRVGSGGGVDVVHLEDSDVAKGAFLVLRDGDDGVRY